MAYDRYEPAAAGASRVRASPAIDDRPEDRSYDRGFDRDATATIAASSSAPATKSPAGSATRKPSAGAAKTRRRLERDDGSLAAADRRSLRAATTNLRAMTASPRFRDEGYRRPYTGRSRPAATAAAKILSADGRRLWPLGERDWDDRPARQLRRHGFDRRGALHDPHYSEWRRRQIDELDRDYDDYRRENQSHFENDFAQLARDAARASGSCSARSASIWTSSASTRSMSAPSTASPATASS